MAGAAIVVRVAVPIGTQVDIRMDADVAGRKASYIEADRHLAATVDQVVAVVRVFGKGHWQDTKRMRKRQHPLIASASVKPCVR